MNRVLPLLLELCYVQLFMFHSLSCLHIKLCECTHTHTLLHPRCGSLAHFIVGWGAGTLSPSSGRDARSVGRGSSLRNRRSSNHLHAITLRTPLSTPPPRFICVAPAGLTAEQFPGGAGGKYISLIKDIW